MLIIKIILLSIVVFSNTIFAKNIAGFEVADKTEYVYLDFWASWCLPCQKSFPVMQKLHERYQKSGLTVIAVNVDENTTQAKEFLQKFKTDFKIVYDPKGKLAEKYNILGMPSSYVLDKNGEILTTHLGFNKTKQKEINRYFKELFK
jgi:thiol-disulfide isomerase/thioredoxin